jgi:hypothetical protein
MSSLLEQTLCEGIPVLHHSRFYPRPSGRDHFKAMRGLDIWNLCLALCLQNLWFIPVNKLANFGYVMGVLLPRKFKFILRIF